MKPETNWHKHVAIGTYILLGITVVLWLIDRFSPSDPAHPWSSQFLAKRIVIQPWLAAGILTLVAVGFSGLGFRAGRRRTPVAIPSEADSAPIASKPKPTFSLELHPTSLDKRVDTPGAKVNFTAKLRVSFRNTGKKPIHILPPRWEMGATNISLQCGAPPFPGVPYASAMLEMGYFYQLEEYRGSWKLEKWKKKANSNDDDEVKDVMVEPDQTFRLWIGLNPCVPHDVLEKRRRTNQLGNLVLSAIVEGQECQWSTEV